MPLCRCAARFLLADKLAPEALRPLASQLLFGDPLRYKRDPWSVLATIAINERNGNRMQPAAASQQPASPCQQPAARSLRLSQQTAAAPTLQPGACPAPQAGPAARKAARRHDNAAAQRLEPKTRPGQELWSRTD
eukprot:COSAG01_NODE_14056_length_1501_cov_22.734665_2_plen_134_part_01